MSTLEKVTVLFLSLFSFAVVTFLSAKYFAPFLKKMNKRLFDKLGGRTGDTGDREQ